jgi:hypothetical protein
MTCGGRATLMFLATGLLLSGPVAAYTLDDTSIRHSAGVYTVAFDMRLDADAAQVRSLMTDYDRLDRLSDIVIDSRVLDVMPDGSKRMQLDVRACVWIFCRTVRRVQDVATLDNGDLSTRALPERSDFSHAVERWRIDASGGGTRIRYNAQLAPSFFVPPLLGPYLMKQAIRRELISAAQHLEALAPVGGRIKGRHAR